MSAHRTIDAESIAMNVPLSRSSLREAANRMTDPCVTLYVPVAADHRQHHENELRVRALVRQARGELNQWGFARNSEALSTTIDALIGQRNFWTHATPSLAVLWSPSAVQHFWVRRELPESVRVGRRPSTRPLLEALEGDHSFRLLTISENHARLYEGGRHELRRMEAPTLPPNLVEALAIDEHENSPQFHTVDSVRLGKRALVAYGHSGGADESQKDALRRYFREIDQAILNLPDAKRDPLVVMSVRYYWPIYREESSYPLLLEGPSGHPDRLQPRDLHRAAWDTVRKHFASVDPEAGARARWYVARSKLKTALDEVVRAAVDGQVETLFVDPTAHEWGWYDERQRRVCVHAERVPGDEDLLDRCVAATLHAGGEVIIVDANEIPDQASAAAGLRI